MLDGLEKAGLVALADKGYQGSTWAKVPYKGRNKPEPQKEANRAHAKLPANRSLNPSEANLAIGTNSTRRIGVVSAPAAISPSVPPTLHASNVM